MKRNYEESERYKELAKANPNKTIAFNIDQTVESRPMMVAVFTFTLPSPCVPIRQGSPKVPISTPPHIHFCNSTWGHSWTFTYKMCLPPRAGVPQGVRLIQSPLPR